MSPRTGRNQPKSAQIGQTGPDTYDRRLLKKLKRRLPVIHCRAELGWPSDFEQFALAIGDQDMLSHGKKRKESDIRLWQYRAAGALNTAERELRLMETVVPDTRAMVDHPIFTLLENELLVHDTLISTIYRLSPEIVAQLLIELDHERGIVEPKRTLGEDDLFTVQSIATLDAVAGLLAISRLLEERSDQHAHVLARMAVCASAKTFIWLTLKMQYQILADDFWYLIKIRYLNRLAPGVFDSWKERQQQYKRVLTLFEAAGVIGPSWEEKIRLLSLADRKNFPDIMTAVDSELASWQHVQHPKPVLRPPLSVLAGGYFHAYASITPESHTWNGRESRIRRMDDLIADPDADGPFNRLSDPYQSADLEKPVLTPDSPRSRRSSRPVPAGASTGQK